MTREHAAATALAPASAAPSWGTRLVGVEGLRALAALSVLANHVILQSGSTAGLGIVDRLVVPNLAQGLTLFFVLSGFLLYRPFAAAILGDRPMPSARRFLRNRALRIVPAYWTILLLSALVFGVALTRSGEPTSAGYLTAPWTLLKNLLFVQNLQPGSVDTGIEAAWSLCVEAVFYLSLPVLGLAALRLARGRGRRGRQLAALAPIAVLLVVGMTGKAIAYKTQTGAADEIWGSSWHAVLERSFLCWADLFAYGMAAALVVLAADAGRVPHVARLRTLSGAGAVLITLAMVAVQSGGAQKPVDRPMALACALLVLWVVLPGGRRRRSPLLRVLESVPAVELGVISYSVYLWHEPVIHWLRRHDLVAGGAGGMALNVLLTLAIVVALSLLTYRFVEAPALRRKARIVPQPAGSERVAPEPAPVQAAP